MTHPAASFVPMGLPTAVSSLIVANSQQQKRAGYETLISHPPELMSAMQRVLIVGSSGAGKSTLARQLGSRLGLPVHHLDQYFWCPGWVKTPEETRVAIVKRLVKGEKWIIDGTYRQSLDMRLKAADTVIFLDLPRWVCVYRAARRRVQYRAQKRDDIADNCDESLLNLQFPRFLRKIWEYPEQTRPTIVASLNRLDDHKRLYWLRTKQQVRQFRADPLHYTPIATTINEQYQYSG
jgi:adenylate kinase family enzyme